MRKRDVRQWATKQYSGDVEPWPRWARWTVAAGALVLLVLKLSGVL